MSIVARAPTLPATDSATSAARIHHRHHPEHVGQPRQGGQMDGLSDRARAEKPDASRLGGHVRTSS